MIVDDKWVFEYKERVRVSKIPLPKWRIFIVFFISKILNVKIKQSTPYRWRYGNKKY